MAAAAEEEKIRWRREDFIVEEQRMKRGKELKSKESVTLLNVDVSESFIFGAFCAWPSLLPVICGTH